jgi:hypothetical protein
MGKHDDDERDARDGRTLTDPRLTKHLAACEAAYRAGNMAAITDAVTWCEIYGCAPPGWLGDAVARLVDLRTTPAERDARREAMLHYDRYDAVQELLERGEQQLDGGPLRNLADIYVRVAEHFGVSDKTIERSCSIVRRDIEAGHGAKYFQPVRRRF